MKLSFPVVFTMRFRNLAAEEALDSFFAMGGSDGSDDENVFSDEAAVSSAEESELYRQTEVRKF